jgi:Tfp pilus assembly protein PilX
MTKNLTTKQNQNQNGVILLVTLLALVIMMLASLALVRSTDTNLILAGNYAFKRDVVNQAEQAVPKIKSLFTSGALQSASSRTIDNSKINYYASIQANNTQGLPNVLLGLADNDANNIIDTQSGVTVRYIIDRMSISVGAPSIDNGGFVPINQINNAGDGLIRETGTSGNPNRPQVNGGMVSLYRISIRATGPRNTESFLQVIFTI